MTPFYQDHKELKELLTFGFDCQDAVNASLADDGQITKKDFPNLFPVLGSATAGLDGVGNPWERYKSLTDEERADLVSYAATRFDLNNDDLEALVRETLLELAGDIRVARKWAAYARR